MSVSPEATREGFPYPYLRRVPTLPLCDSHRENAVPASQEYHRTSEATSAPSNIPVYIFYKLRNEVGTRVLFALLYRPGPLVLAPAAAPPEPTAVV